MHPQIEKVIFCSQKLDKMLVFKASDIHNRLRFGITNSINKNLRLKIPLLNKVLIAYTNQKSLK